MPITDYAFWNLVVNALTAVGTVSAVIVALFLPRKQEEPKIHVSAGPKYLVGNVRVSPQQGMCIQAQNVGIRDEHVVIYGYEIGLLRMLGIKFRNGSCIIKVDGSSGIPDTCGFPSDVAPGYSAYHLLSFDDFNEKQLQFFIDYIESICMLTCIKKQKWFLKVAMFSAKCWVKTSRDKVVVSRIEKGMREYILDAYLQQSVNVKSTVEGS